MPSEVAIDPNDPSLGCIRADSITPPHTAKSIIQCIKRVERIETLASANLFAGISCDAPLTPEGYISILHSDGPGQSMDEPMALVLPGKYFRSPLAIPEGPLAIPEGIYVIKNRATNAFWSAGHNPIKTVYHYDCEEQTAKASTVLQVN
jgi:hypothetical protein